MRTIPIPDGSTPYSTQRVTLTGRVFDLAFAYNFRRNIWKINLYTAEGEALLLGQTIGPGWDLLRRNPSDDMPGGELRLAPRAGVNVNPDLDTFEREETTLVYFEPDELADLEAAAA